MLGIDSSTLYTTDAPPTHIVQTMTVATAVLVLVSAIPEQVQQSLVVERGVCMLLFLYADAAKTLLLIVDGVLPTFAALLFYVLMHHHNKELSTRRSTTYVMRGANMVAINFLMRSLATVSGVDHSIEVETVMYLAILFALDAMQQTTDFFAETRDYAVWKASQQLFLAYSAYDVNLVLSLSAVAVFVCTPRAWAANTQLVFQLTVLVSGKHHAEARGHHAAGLRRHGQGRAALHV